MPSLPAKSTMPREWRYSAYFICGEQTSGRSRRYITVGKLCGEEVKRERVENWQQHLILDCGPTKLYNKEYLKLLEEEQLDEDGLSMSDLSCSSRASSIESQQSSSALSHRGDSTFEGLLQVPKNTASSTMVGKKRKASGNQAIDAYLEHNIAENIRHRYNRKLFRWFVDSNIPFNAISSPFFEDFIGDIRSAYRFPSRQALATDI